MTRPALILTRPMAEAMQWRDALSPEGWPVLVWPLIEIQALSPPENHLAQAWHELSTGQAAMFVSRAAVQYFFADRPKGIDWPAHVRAWCTGPGTRLALIEQGLPPEVVDHPPSGSTWDTEHLWPVVSGQVTTGFPVLIVRGTDRDPTQALQAPQGAGRDWLAQQIVGQGGRVRWAVAYRRAGPVWDAGQLERARSAAADGSVWLFSSAQALGHLQHLLPDQDWHEAHALATHPRIAAKAGQMGFGRVQVCPPSPPEVLALLKSMS